MHDKKIKKRFHQCGIYKIKPLRLHLSHTSVHLQEDCSVTCTRFTCVYTRIHDVNCTAKSDVNDNTWSRTCALILLCSSCDFYVNWKDLSMLGKQ